MIKDIFIAIIGGFLGWSGVKIEEWIKEKRSTSLFFDFDEQKLTSTYDEGISIIKTEIDGQAYPPSWLSLDSSIYYENNLPAFAEVKSVQEIRRKLVITYVYDRQKKTVKFIKP